MITHQTDHAGAALAKLLEQFKGQPDLEKFLRAFLQGHQDIEDTLWQLYTQRTIDAAEGVQLDVIGRIVDQPRGNSVDDSMYRKRLKARVRVLRSSGTTEEILAVFFALLGDWSAFKFVPSYPAGFDFTIFGIITEVDAELYNTFLFRAKAAGVYGNEFYQVFDDADSFVCSPTVAFNDGVIGPGDQSIVALDMGHGPPFASWPASGGIVILDRGAAVEELLTYDSVGFGGFVLVMETDQPTMMHGNDGLCTIELYGDAGLGFGDSTNPSTGGGLAGAKAI